jgi:hypothetical protein
MRSANARMPLYVELVDGLGVMVDLGRSLLIGDCI